MCTRRHVSDNFVFIVFLSYKIYKNGIYHTGKSVRRD